MGIALAELRKSDPERARAADAVQAIRDEMHIWRPLRWARQRRILRQLRKESPAEWAHWRTVQWHLFGWACLCVASLAALLSAAGI